MQVLSSLFKKAEHHQELDPMACGTLSVLHIIFADDLMVLLKADKRNARRIKQLLDEFSVLSGLRINYAKSAIYFGGSTQHRAWIYSHLGLNVGDLPTKYLGLPLLSKRLSASACAPLILAVTARLQSWKARLLSYAGRVELVKSVLSSMQVYCMSVFILPASVL